MAIFFIIGFVALWCSAMLWLYLCYRLFKLLEKNHPHKFAEMGSPNLGENNTLSSNVALFKFLYQRQWQALDDKGLATLAGFMRILLFALLLCLALIFLAVPYLATRYS